MRNIDEIGGLLTAGLRDGVYGAAAVAIAVDGEVVAEHAVGQARTWDGPGVLAGEEWPATDAATRFDLASITKLVTAATLLTLLDERRADASLPVAEVLPEFTDPATDGITVAHLLSHTAGFPAGWADRSPDAGAVRFRAGARPVVAPGSVHRYSCVGYIWAGLVAEALGGAPLDVLAERCVLGPLGMSETGFRPPAALRARIVATEFQSEPPRGVVQGEVHDETAWALGGVVGNAGLFGTARDLLRLAEALRLPPGGSPLAASVVRAMTTPVTVADDGYGQALGGRVDEAWASGMTAPAVGHTGFTGTAVATEAGGRRSVVFLTNRVHPQRASAEPIQVMRRRVADAAAAAIVWGAHR
ncbi:serine hydrolase domain-containing protein [Microbacterium sp. zg.Y909]|uniref:serine hydrolase domain-containing protein n=1 Tax=Microbacterium sp. zg.Y909 TaxID=2969413 RepID=UPI00214A999E|nr:serine hydrolase domain-containing protein [Microbacterium sp. zg.Y909]MCR2826571.1 beta-lactamase family protein [Microbacterium sp. zg.Y909]